MHNAYYSLHNITTTCYLVIMLCNGTCLFCIKENTATINACLFTWLPQIFMLSSPLAFRWGFFFNVFSLLVLKFKPKKTFQATSSLMFLSETKHLLKQIKSVLIHSGHLQPKHKTISFQQRSRRRWVGRIFKWYQATNDLMEKMRTLFPTRK